MSQDGPRGYCLTYLGELDQLTLEGGPVPCNAIGRAQGMGDLAQRIIAGGEWQETGYCEGVACLPGVWRRTYTRMKSSQPLAALQQSQVAIMYAPRPPGSLDRQRSTVQLSRELWLDTESSDKGSCPRSTSFGRLGWSLWFAS